jgi:uncharacterized protein YceH (UPF0502 family)
VWYTVVTAFRHYKEVNIYIRRMRSREHGPYFQLVRSYREGGRVKQEVLVHLGEHETPEAALAAWPSEIEHLRVIGRESRAEKLESKLAKLRELRERRNDNG